MSLIYEYIWLDAKGIIRSKTRCLSNHCHNLEWTYDASSTGQAPSNGDTEGVLIPRFQCIHPFFEKNASILLCDTYDIYGNPLKGNWRSQAHNIFMKKRELEPWFGLEQEFFIWSLAERPTDNNNPSDHYCRGQEMEIIREHMTACIKAGLHFAGWNAEVVPHQWEFQIGPCGGIGAADELIVARFLLEQIAWKYHCTIDFTPKPFPDKNGSGCHTNFSTKAMRQLGGLKEMERVMPMLEANHLKHLDGYGKDNHLRLTGVHETSSFDTFSWGVGTRNTSVRIPVLVQRDGCGYFEDRRPAANMDPYLVTSLLFETCCL